MAATGRFRATFRLPDSTGRDVTVAPDEHLLDAGLAAGLDLPYSCLQGWCLTCAARLVEGEVDQSDSTRYYAEDRRAGFVLPCTGRPRSNVVLVTHARDAMRRAREQYGLPFPRGDWGKGPG
jgi:ferredoxin